MKVLIAQTLESELARRSADRGLGVAPRLAGGGPAAGRELLAESPDLLLIDARAWSWADLAPWADATPRAVVVCGPGAGPDAAAELERELRPMGAQVVVAPGGSHPEAALDAALAAGEAARSRDRARADLEAAGLGAQGPGGQGEVLMVGAGIVNLVSALALARAGHRVRIVDAAPDPRRSPRASALGSTHGGGDGRIASLLEGRHLGARAGRGPCGRFRRTVSEGGWALRPGHERRPVDAAWLQAFSRLPAWRESIFDRDLIAFNREGLEGWDELWAREPELLRGTDLRSGLLALYEDPEAWDRARLLQEEHGALRRALRPGELTHRHPALAEATAELGLVGGLEIEGFSLRVWRLVERLLERLEASGVEIRWRWPARSIAWDGQGRVEGVETAAGRLRATHYVVSPGSLPASAEGPGPLAGLRAEGRLSALLGVWLQLPLGSPPLERAVKLHLGAERALGERPLIEDSNLFPLGQDSGGGLLAGGGYALHHGPVGPEDRAEIEVLFQALAETSSRAFPRAPAVSAAPRWSCSRPLTADGLGLFELAPSNAGGLLVLTGGHGTAGFTQAPAIGRAVAASLAGADHPMQWKYWPGRSS